MNLGVHTVTVLRAATVTDRYGNTTSERNWSTPAATVVEGCSVQPLAGVENLDRRDAVTSRWQLFAPAGIDLQPTDRVRYDGDDYDVDGQVQAWDFKPLEHIVALLQRTEG